MCRVLFVCCPFGTRRHEEGWTAFHWMLAQEHDGNLNLVPDARTYNTALDAAVATNDRRAIQLVTDHMQERSHEGDAATRSILAKAAMAAAGGGEQGAMALSRVLRAERSHGGDPTNFNTAVSALSSAGNTAAAIAMLHQLEDLRVVPSEVCLCSRVL